MKLQKCERDLRKKEDGTKPVPIVRDREEENLVGTMYEQNNKLKSQAVALKGKIKSLQEELEKKKKEIAVIKMRVQQPATSHGGG